MVCRDVFFALSSSEKDHLLALDSDEKRLEYIQEEIEGARDEARLLETDKAWDAMHRCLTDGTLTFSHSSTPLGRLILGGIQLYSDRQSYIINLTETVNSRKLRPVLRQLQKSG